MTLADIITSFPASNIVQLHKAWRDVLQKSGLKKAMPYLEREDQEKERIIRLLPDLSRYKLQIFEYTEFDMLAYNIDDTEYKISIAYRPKGVPVSFWTANFKDCNIIDTPKLK